MCSTPNWPSTGLPGLTESAGEPPQASTPLTPLMEVVKAAKCVKAAKVVEMEGVAGARETEEDVALVTPHWTQICPSRAAVPVGCVPHSLGDKQCCHCSHSDQSRKRAYLWAEQDEQSGGPSSSASGSPTTTHNCSPLATSSPRAETSMEGSIARLQAPPPGFADIANVLWRSQPPQTPLRPIEE